MAALTSWSAGTVFQSTPPRGRRLLVGWHGENILMVSIHASAREATHGPTIYLIFQLGFNPRLREGGDFVVMDEAAFMSRVSIHASAREATLLRFPPAYHARCFNPRLREGGDVLPHLRPALSTLFQSTPPRGRRQIVKLKIVRQRIVSIHASAREATARFGYFLLITPYM